MNQVLDFAIPQWFEDDDLEFINALDVSSDEDLAVIVVGENLDGQKVCHPTVRLYLAERLNEKFECTKEIDAFLFDTVEEVNQFVSQLPKMDAIQFLAQSKKYKRSFT